MRSAKRVDQLFKGLTARERGVLALRSMKLGTDEDPQIKYAMPESQVGEYNRLVALMNGANSGLGPYALLVKAMVDQASIRVGWLMTANLLALCDEESRTAVFAGDLSETLIAQLESAVECQWQEIRAVEILSHEVAGEFGGEDVLMPELREIVDEAKTDLKDVADTLRRFGVKTKRPAPAGELLGQVRSIVHRELNSLDRRLLT